MKSLDDEVSLHIDALFRLVNRVQYFMEELQIDLIIRVAEVHEIFREMQQRKRFLLQYGNINIINKYLRKPATFRFGDEVEGYIKVGDKTLVFLISDGFNRVKRVVEDFIKQ